MHFIRILFLLSISAVAFGALKIPKEPIRPTIPKGAMTITSSTKLPNLKAPYLDVSSASKQATAYVIELDHVYKTQSKANAQLKDFHALDVPAYLQTEKNGDIRIYLGPELDPKRLEKMMIKVQRSPQTGKIQNFNVYSLDKK